MFPMDWSAKCASMMGRFCFEGRGSIIIHEDMGEAVSKEHAERVNREMA